MTKRIAVPLVLFVTAICCAAGTATQPAQAPDKTYQVPFPKLGITVTITCSDPWRVASYDESDPVLTDAPMTEHHPTTFCVFDYKAGPKGFTVDQVLAALAQSAKASLPHAEILENKVIDLPNHRKGAYLTVHGDFSGHDAICRQFIFLVDDSHLFMARAFMPPEKWPTSAAPLDTILRSIIVAPVNTTPAK